MDEKIDPEVGVRHHSNVDGEEIRRHNVQPSEVLADKDMMNHAYDGENKEHEMGVWQSAKMYPMACLWAFIFCFTIVSQ